MAINELAPLPKLLLFENSVYKTGAFRAALSAAKALRDSYEVEFILPKASNLIEEVTYSGFICHVIPTIEIGRSWRKLFLYFPTLMINTIRLRRLLSCSKAVGLVVNDYYNMLGVCIRVSGWNGKILTVVQLLPDNQHPVLNKIWIKLGLLYTNKLITVSKAVAGQCPSHPKVEVIYNPVCCIEKHATSFLPSCANDELVYCLYPANYIAGKGHELALYAFARALQVHSSLRLRFVGSDMGLEKNRALKVKLQLTANQLNLKDFVSIDDFSSDIELDIKNSHIVLNFSRSESFSMTCAEASVFGRPIIATRCGGPEEVVKDGVTGLLVGVDDVPAMTVAILKLAESMTMRQQFGKAGYYLIREKFTDEKFRVRFNEVWNSIQ